MDDFTDDLSRLVRELNASVQGQEEAQKRSSAKHGPALRRSPSRDHSGVEIPGAEALLARILGSDGTPEDTRSTGGTHPRSPNARHDSPSDDIAILSSHLDELLAEAAARGASDLLFVVGVPAAIRINGVLTPIGDDPMTPAGTRSISLALLDELRYREFQRTKASDFTFERPGIGRFRCDLHFQQGTIAVAIRVLPAAIPTFADLNLPAVYERFAHLTRGLVLFCGPTGCGKSTTMASLLDRINRDRASHIITIEDPIEYVHRHNRSIIEQIEIGHDSPSFASALRHALRQDPDVILVGEMRDLETIAIALTAAETGHLVLSTLHTSDAAQSVDRIIDAFPEDQQNQIRQQLSLSLVGIAVQSLVPTADGRRRVPACELLLATDPVRNLIRTAKNHLIHAQITMGRRDGMMTLEDSLAELVRSGRIARSEAMLRASHRDELDKLLA